MYQLEVKRWLVFYKFPAEEGWNVTIDIDAMERGKKKQLRPRSRRSRPSASRGCCRKG